MGGCDDDDDDDDVTLAIALELDLLFSLSRASCCIASQTSSMERGSEEEAIGADRSEDSEKEWEKNKVLRSPFLTPK